NSVFYGLGTYGTAIAMAQLHWSFGSGLVFGAVLGVACALLFGIPILRLRGPYFAIATLGLAAVMSAITATVEIAGKNIGLILPLFGGPGTVLGPVLGALILSAVSEVLASQATGVASLFYGIVIVAAVLLMPKGLLDLVQGFRDSGWRYFVDNVRRYRI